MSNTDVKLDPNGFNELKMCRLGPMVYNKNDTYIGASLRKYGEFSWHEQELFRQIVRPGFIVVEAGANIGAHTVGLARLVGPGGAVFAFEPQRIVFQTLCANAALNQCINVHAYQQALGVDEGSLTVPILDPTVHANFGGLSLKDHLQGETVPVRKLDSLDLPGCHLLKVDVEGMEIEVLKGASATIARHRPVLYVENDREDRSPELIELIMGYGYRLYWHLPLLFNADNLARDREDIFPNILSVNLLCVAAEAGTAVEGMPRVNSPSDTWKSTLGG